MSKGTSRSRWGARGLAAMLACASAAVGAQTGTEQSGEAIAIPIIEGIDLEMVQEAWQSGKATKRVGQSRPGAKIYRYCDNCVYRVATRTGTTTSLRIDPEEVVVTIVNGNRDALEAKGLKLVPNVVEVRARKIGIDTSVKLYSASGKSYIFWIATEDNTAETTSDLVVDVLTEQRAPESAHAGASGDAAKVQYREGESGGGWERLTAAGAEMERAQRAQITAMRSPLKDRSLIEQEYANLGIDVFDPSQLVFDLEMQASTPEARDALAPARVFRDQHWTWLDYKNKSGSALMPAISLVTEGTETPVDWAVYGENGRFLVAKAVGNLALRSGQHILCIKVKRPEPHLTDSEGEHAAAQPVTLGPPGSRPATGVPMRAAGQPQMVRSPRAVLMTYPKPGEEARARTIVTRHIAEAAGDGPYDEASPEQAHRACRALAKAGIECEVHKP